ncbi:MAG: class I SAM-dependent methyltransferase [Promethearchaeota archaeon]
MSKSDPKSRVEIHGFEAKHYDALMNLISFGSYKKFIKSAIAAMKITPNDKILDLGAGTGRNACLMHEYLSEKGKYVGMDISEEMMRQFKKKCSAFPNMSIVNQRIDEPFSYENEFDKAFSSFVIHGFPQEKRIKILQNIWKALKPGGYFFLLDYNQFNLEEKPWFARKIFKTAECPYAFDFIEKDWESIMSDLEFGDFNTKLYFHGYMRLLKAKKIIK